LLVFSLLANSGAGAFIYDVTVLKRWDSTRGRYQKVFAYSDFHDRPTTVMQQAHREQHEVFAKLFSTLNKQTAKVIVEDLCCPNDRGCATCGNFFISPNGGILGGLTQKCQVAGVPVCNVEFRFCRVTSLGPIFNAPSSTDPENFQSTKAITIGTLRDEITTTMREIESYRDGSFLQTVYREGMQGVAKGIAEFGLARENAASVATYITQHTQPATKMERLKKLLTFDSELLDHKILHQIVTAGDKETIIIIAGGSHCTNVCQILKKMGYEQANRKPERHEYLGVGVPKPLNLAMVRL
jgi:hypothetical protein